ncbi:RNA recognition motif domain eukaryote [Penicillium cf. griseofulvum]|uniref:RNA recognition motif domain eukaryote n=1 Tax=Penicillium cf. griseofulvum TaxID=2972120 RepID=A0A9W9M8E9_9EURO|nr:RNA recognition motif domain eukaryote [Penicillium cf. griseofulvum]KAJ5444925.1 RNA recognition motif domain eukaryote [Penicillium cf. griseofulvum]KAJ5446639.1 RNA recognition motif domain eukaryote [Penicillium cf. griseofulvum]
MVELHKKRRLSGDESPEVKVEATTPAAEASAAQNKRTLFVRSLPTSATTESLAEHFSQSYIIKHAVVVCDKETKVSKGFGFVTFADVEDAESALKELNGSKFDGKIIRVDYAESRKREIDEKIGRSVPTAASREIKKQKEEERGQGLPPKLIVRNLPWSIKEPEDLNVLFRSFGKVKFVTLPKRNGKLSGFGFITMRGRKNAEKALQMINGKEIDGRQLAVDWAVEKDVWETTKKEDDEQEEQKEEKDSGDVEMEDAEGVLEEPSENETSSDEDEDDDEDKELDELDELDEDEEDEEEDDRNATTIFIRNLPFTATDQTLYDHFKTHFGPLRYARVVLDYETERPRGTGFVCFWKPEDANTCIREAPRGAEAMAPNKDKPKSNTAMKHSVLNDENSDPSGRYTLEGRVLQVARAVSKGQASKLEEEGASRRMVRDTDKRHLYLLNEGTIPSNSPLYKKLSPSEIKMREDSYKQRETFIKKNPALHLSLTRLAIRNLPRHIDSKELKQLARESVVEFAKDVKAGKRHPLSKEEQQRSRDTMKELEQLRKQKKMGIVRQAKVVFETREGTKVSEKTGGGRSRGYGFIEFFTHRHALMSLRWLNCHSMAVPPSTQTPEDRDKKKSLVVEFAIENAQVVKRRNELQAKSREPKREDYAEPKGDKKRKRSDTRDGKGKDGRDGRNGKDGRDAKRGKTGNGNGAKDEKVNEEEDKAAKRNRIIGQKRMKRKSRKGN